MRKYIEWGIAFLILKLIFNHYFEPMTVKSVIIILLETIVWPVFAVKFIWDYVIHPKLHR
ncbi:MAG: hypothetical protein M0P10_07435 [Sphaerochaetaceae bacterium]|nr:hypothetical protein [Sphaerochaetaceae bacterium]